MNWRILSILLFSLANGGYYTTSYARFKTNSFLTHQFYLSDYEIGNQILNLSIFRTNAWDSVALRLTKDMGYDLKWGIKPTPSLDLYLLTNHGRIEDRDTLSLSKFENSSLGGEILFQKSSLILHSILKKIWELSGSQTLQDTTSLSDKGGESYNELRISHYGLSFLLLLHHYSLYLTQNRLALYIEPAGPLTVGKLRVNFKLTRLGERRDYFIGDKREERSLHDYRGFIFFSYPLFPSINIEFRDDYTYEVDEYKLLQYKGLSAKSNRIEAKLDFNPTERINSSLIFKRDIDNTERVLNFGNEDREKKFLNCRIDYEHSRGYFSFSQRTSLEAINTPYPLNKNDRDLLDNTVKTSGKLRINPNLSLEWKIETRLSDVIYIERFMSGNSFSKKSLLIEGKVDIPVVFGLHLKNKILFNTDKLSYPFASRRDNLSKKRSFDVNILYENYPSFIPQMSIGSSFEDYGGYYKELYEPEVFYTKPRLSFSLFYHPFPNFSITPMYEAYRIETTTLFWKEPFGWEGKVAGISGEIKLSMEGFLSFNIKRERRENEKDCWLANISINYNF